MKKKILKAIMVASLCVATFIALAIPCFAVVSDSSITNNTNINLQSIVYTDENYADNYSVSGFSFVTPRLGSDNNLTVYLFGLNEAQTGYIGVRNSVSYSENHSAYFRLVPHVNGDSNNAYYYPRMFYFGESYMNMAELNWGTIQFNYANTFDIAKIENERLFISITYQYYTVRGNVNDRLIYETQTRTVNTTVDMIPNARTQTIDIKQVVSPLIQDGSGSHSHIVHINSLKFSRINDVDGLLPCDSVNINDLSYYSTDGDDLPTWYTQYRDFDNSLNTSGDINVDFTSWISTAIGGFLNFELVPGLSIWSIFLGVIGIGLVVAFLKYFAGG